MTNYTQYIYSAPPIRNLILTRHSADGYLEKIVTRCLEKDDRLNALEAIEQMTVEYKIKWITHIVCLYLKEGDRESALKIVKEQHDVWSIITNNWYCMIAQSYYEAKDNIGMLQTIRIIVSSEVDRLFLWNYTLRVYESVKSEFISYLTEKAKLLFPLNDTDLVRQTVRKLTSLETLASFASPKNKTAYSVMGLPATATLEQVKKQYKRLILLCHPDKVSRVPEETFNVRVKVAQDKFTTISNAYKEIMAEK